MLIGIGNNSHYNRLTILHPCLDVVRIKDFQYTRKDVCNIIQEKIHTNMSYLYDRCWLWLYFRWNWSSRENEFEKNVGGNSDEEYGTDIKNNIGI